MFIAASIGNELGQAFVINAQAITAVDGIKVLARQTRIVLREVVRIQVLEIDMCGFEEGVEVLSGALAVFLVEVDAFLQGEANVGNRDVAAVTRTKSGVRMSTCVLMG